MIALSARFVLQDVKVRLYLLYQGVLFHLFLQDSCSKSLRGPKGLSLALVYGNIPLDLVDMSRIGISILDGFSATLVVESF